MKKLNPIIVDKVSKFFKKGKIRALNKVSFEIKEGEIFGLLGPNGAGKTTMIKCISTLLIPDEGQIKVAGYDTKTEELKVRQKIGLLTSGERSLYWKLTPIDNLKYFGALYGVPQKILNDRIEYLLNIMGLWERRNDRVETFSQGMKQKLAIARMLIHDPPILLVDEPTVGLDPQFSRFIRKFLKEELNKKQGKTILLTTHYMEEAKQLSDRIAFINKGEIQVIDTPENLEKIVPSEKIIELKFEKINHYIVDKIKKIKNVSKVKTFSNENLKIVQIFTNEPEEILKEIFIVIGEHKINGFEIRKPTLEDAFIYLTGEKLK